MIGGMTPREFKRLELPRYKLARRPPHVREVAKATGIPAVQLEYFIAARRISAADLRKLQCR